MKANAPKRKVFQDAVDLISPETVGAVANGHAMIPAEWKGKPISHRQNNRESDNYRKRLKEH